MAVGFLSIVVLGPRLTVDDLGWLIFSLHGGGARTTVAWQWQLELGPVPCFSLSLSGPFSATSTAWRLSSASPPRQLAPLSLPCSLCRSLGGRTQQRVATRHGGSNISSPMMTPCATTLCSTSHGPTARRRPGAPPLPRGGWRCRVGGPRYT
jgi:hypothetical protein